MLLRLLVRLANGSFSRLFATVTSLVSLGLMRALAIGGSSTALGLAEEVDWRYRIAGGVTVTVLNSIIIGIVVGENAEFRRKKVVLTQREVELTELNEFVTKNLKKKRDQVLREIRATLRAAISKVTLGDSGGQNLATAREASQTLLRIADEVVRPLSHRLIPGAFVSKSSSPDSASAKSSFRAQLFRASVTVSPFQPGWVSLIWLAVGYSTFSAIDAGALGLIAYGALVFVNFLTQLLAARLVTLHLVRLSSFRSGLAVASIYIASALLVTALTYLPLAQFSNSNYPNLRSNLLIQLPVQLCLSYVLLAMIAGFRHQRRQSIAELQEVNARLRRQLAVREGILLSLGRDIGKSLHNDVQGALVASAIKLQRAIDSGDVSQELIKDIQSVLRDSLDLRLKRNTEINLKSFLHEYAEKLGDSIVLRWEFLEESDKLIERDRNLSSNLTEVVSDLATNSIKHGAASEIRLTFSRVNDSTISLSASDDGRFESVAIVPGVGFNLLEKLALNYTVKSLKPGFNLQAQFPVNSGQNSE